MPLDIKEQIVRKALELLKDGKTRKLTVKDIVEACSITRQTFYYHFDDVPQLFEWIIRKESDRLLSYSPDDVEQGIRLFFVAAINALPYVRKGMQSNYRDEFEHILSRSTYDLFNRVIERKGLYSDCSVRELAVIRRYHAEAIIGILRDWSDSDTENIDSIVHIIYRLITGQIAM